MIALELAAAHLLRERESKSPQRSLKTCNSTTGADATHTVGAGTKYGTAGFDAMYSTTGAEARYNVGAGAPYDKEGAGAMYSSTGTGETATAGTGSMYSITSADEVLARCTR